MILLIAVGVILFLAISALLARAFSVSSAEEAAITSLVRAEARGDQSSVIALITRCRSDASCRARAATVTSTLRHRGSVTIIQINPSSNFSLGSTLGTARVAWTVGNSLPRVQCLRVRHAGNILSGFRVALLEVSQRIRSNADCPKRF
jgi:hypothetical protein